MWLDLMLLKYTKNATFGLIEFEEKVFYGKAKR